MGKLALAWRLESSKPRPELLLCAGQVELTGRERRVERAFSEKLLKCPSRGKLSSKAPRN